MAYGTVKVDNITFDNGGSDQNVTVSGLYRATTSGVTLSGTIAATTVSGVTVIGSTTVSGATVTGTIANFTSGNFSNIISSAATMSGALIMANQQQIRFREAVGNGVNHIALQAPAIVSADQTITLPDQTGTVITTGDNGSVSSTMLATNLTISAAAGTAAAPSIAFTGDPNTGIYSPGADQLAVSTGGTGRLFVAASGFVGIGASPALPFDVATADDTGVRLRATTNGVDVRINALGLTGNAGQIGTWSNNPFVFRTNNTERLRITADGKVGIGTSSPTDKLHVNGDIALDEAALNTPKYINFRANAIATEYGGIRWYNFQWNNTIRAAITSGPDAAVANGYLAFATGVGGNDATERARIDSSGRLLVGTSSASGGYLNNNSLVHVQAEGASAGITIHRPTTFSALAGPYLIFNRSRGTPAVIVNSGDNLGSIEWGGADGTDVESTAALIRAEVDGTPGANDMPGRLVFSTTADGAASTTERMRIDSTGRVGIGTSSPGARLQVNAPSTGRSYSSSVLDFSNIHLEGSTANTATSALTFSSGGGGGAAIAFSRDSNIGTEISLWTNYAGGANAATQRMVIDSSGRVGIGTSSPTHSLSVNGNIGSTGGRGSSFGYTLPDWRIYNSSSNNAFVIDNYTTEALRIDSSGNVGIGTSLPGAKLVVQSDSANTSFNTPYFNYAAIVRNDNLTNNNFVGFSFNTKGTGGQDTTLAAMAAQCTNHTTGAVNGNLAFYTEGGSGVTERMRITGAGTVNTFSSTTDAFVSRSSSAAGTTNYNIRCTYAATGALDGTVAFQVSTNGNVTNTNNSYGAISDVKLKENIVDATSQWNDIKALQVRKYNFKEGQTHTQIGLVAQEVELVSPGLVTESPDRDEEGNELGTVTKSVNYSVLYMKAVKALQEAMERIETLEAAVAALQGA